jgi:hypothetical protein
MINVFFVLGETTFFHGNIMTPKETTVLIDEDSMTLGIERENIFSPLQCAIYNLLRDGIPVREVESKSMK